MQRYFLALAGHPGVDQRWYIDKSDEVADSIELPSMDIESRCT